MSTLPRTVPSTRKPSWISQAAVARKAEDHNQAEDRPEERECPVTVLDPAAMPQL